jgi:ubiquinone/menaquinone biosynthesis C-methylase UbiE
MPFYREHIYPHLVNMLGNPKPIREVRQRIIPLAQGRVLEIGVGPGVNFVHYDPARVSKLYALEPNPGMVRLADQHRRRTTLDVEFLDLPGEHIPLEDDTVDTVVSTFTFCTIPGVVEAIRGVGRVLRPGGRLIFFEHGLSPDPRVRRWQEQWEPILCRVFAGCHLTRDIPALITQGGFQIEQMEMAYLTRFPKSWAYCGWGIATRTAVVHRYVSPGGARSPKHRGSYTVIKTDG